MTTDLAAETTDARGARMPIIDGDIHVLPKGPDTLRGYMPEAWRRRLERFGQRGPAGAAYPRANPHAGRADAWPPSGGPPGSDLGFLRAQLLDAWDVEVGILNPLMGAGGIRNLELGAAMAAAINEWQVAEWLDPEPRLRGSLSVAYEDAELAVREIERWGDDRRFAHILLAIRTAEPLGRRKYWPMYEAAVRHGLPIGIHVGGSGGAPVTGAGFHSFYFEDHSGWPTAYQSQIISMVFEGVFERFPELRIVLIEGGFAWMPALLWRMDEAFGRLHDEVPQLRRLPSEYVRRNIWITTQPMEEPPRPGQFRRLLDQMAMDDHLVFATDYPHWDFDAPDASIPERLEPERLEAIMSGNARRLYRLERA